MNLILLILLSVVPVSSNEVFESVDLIELHHFHDFRGRNVYDQVIFYEWSSEHSRYHVRSWVIVEDSQRLPRKRYSDGLHVVKYPDREQKLERVVVSQHFRETWSQTDPERDNKKIFDERLRHKLIQRIEPKPIVSPIVEETE
jgi:hypothetical protein